MRTPDSGFVVARASDTHVAKTVSMTKKYRDNNITGVDFGQEAVQQNWQVKGSEGSVGSDLVQVFSLSIVSK